MVCPHGGSGGRACSAMHIAQLLERGRSEDVVSGGATVDLDYPVQVT
jgi:hypothetical protein